jgi:hypothetical protein
LTLVFGSALALPLLAMASLAMALLSLAMALSQGLL